MSFIQQPDIEKSSHSSHNHKSYHLTSGHSDTQPWASECPDVKDYKWQLNPVWHRMLYSCTHMATVGVKRL